MSYLRCPVHHRLCASLAGCELQDKGSAESPEHQRPCLDLPLLLHQHDSVEEEETGDKKHKLVN